MIHNKLKEEAIWQPMASSYEALAAACSGASGSAPAQLPPKKALKWAIQRAWEAERKKLIAELLPERKKRRRFARRPIAGDTYNPAEFRTY